MSERIINKTAVRDLMDDPPRGQKLHNSFSGNWDLLTDEQLLNVRAILEKEMFEITQIITREINIRNLEI